jgi:hypothetical protein
MEGQGGGEAQGARWPKKMNERELWNSAEKIFIRPFEIRAKSSVETVASKVVIATKKVVSSCREAGLPDVIF